METVKEGKTYYYDKKGREVTEEEFRKFSAGKEDTKEVTGNADEKDSARGKN